MPESAAKRRERAGKILTELKKLYSGADCALHHKSALELLVATILSAQSTDENVNRVTKDLFKKYKKPADYLAVPVEELEEDIRSTGFYRQKTKSVRAMSQALLDDFGGKVPDEMDDLIKLRGVARKTANVVLGTWFKKNEGIAVDTHVGRLAHRWELTPNSKDSKDAVKIEKDLMDTFARDDWTFVSHATILHGRQVCGAKKPDCKSCTLRKLCPSVDQFL